MNPHPSTGGGWDYNTDWRSLHLLFLTLIVACTGRPSVAPQDTDSNSIPDSSVDTQDTGDAAFEPPYLIRGIFGPMLLEPIEHDFDDPDQIRDLGFDTVGLAQYLLLSPDGVQMQMWTDDEIRSIVTGFTDAGLGVSLTLSMGYTPTGSKDDWLWSTNLPSHGVDPEPLMETLTESMVSLIPLARELGIYQLSVNEPDLFLHETHADATPDFSKVSAWGQELRLAMEAAGWGENEHEQLVWKTGYGFLSSNKTIPNTAIDLDFTGYTAAGFSLTPSDNDWVHDTEVFAEEFRETVDRTLSHFADAMPDSQTWPSITEFGAWGCECGFWNAEDASQCTSYWSEAHIQVIFSTVFDAVADWNSAQEMDYRGVFVMDSPTDSTQFGLNYSEAVRETIRTGMERLD